MSRFPMFHVKRTTGGYMTERVAAGLPTGRLLAKSREPGLDRALDRSTARRFRGPEEETAPFHVKHSAICPECCGSPTLHTADPKGVSETGEIDRRTREPAVSLCA
ncbi:hypothetical protein ARHIZOSPH14_14900 [Agromyces rhizosphaerae]|uniref:Uncharacterized protein n=1 Tax=Agromyces rhizosphaerae TaxID=88374 RepID=A0A9W6D0J6_9MICO|nr:hypothetical protein ARHIZOSPH14_14900 [Agromyces rhizosphaerae]